jgi:very-short-patch-repair endonuclease
MGRELSDRWKERHARVWAVASRQWGIATAAQLYECGVTPPVITRWVREHRLQRVFRGVYSVGHRSPAPEARWAAALLYAGDGSALAHHAAAANLGLLPAPKIVHVIVARRVKPQYGLTVHCPSLPLQRGEVTHAKGLPTTTVARTLLDLAAAGEPIERLVANAVARRLVTIPALRAYVARRAGARGAARLRTGIEGDQMRSHAEKEFVRWLKGRAIPVPSMNHKIGPLTVDGLWKDVGLVVEIDTFGTHGTPFSFENDRVRDAYLVARGLRTIRVTPWRWRHDGDRLERDIRAARAHQ